MTEAQNPTYTYPYRLDNIKSVIDWQEAGFVHPLTCGKDSGHTNLLPAMDDKNNLILICPDCDYRQTFVPAMVITVPRTPGFSEMKKVFSEKK